MEQQDTSEAFAFITETLQFPLLPLQVDLFHHGEMDTADHKVVQERLLNISIPADPEGRGIKLEDCLEEFFNARVDVSRDSCEPKEKAANKDIDRRPTFVSGNTIRVVAEADASNPSSEVTDSSLSISPVWKQNGNGGSPQPPLPISPVRKENGDSTQPPLSISPVRNANGEVEGGSSTRPSARTRSRSVIQRVVLDEEGRPAKSPAESPTLLQKAMRTGSTVVKAVTIPAWQFFRFIRKFCPVPESRLLTHQAWHAANTNNPRSDIEVAMNFDQRPVVGICLKRYLMAGNGQPLRHNTFVDIPDSLRLPHFMIAEEKRGQDTITGLSTEYKLVLQSIVCHRGDSTQSGHYIALARVAPKLLTGNRRHDHDPPPDYEEAQWVLFDDLHPENRVSYVDDLKACLREEMPYLLFYQVVPMVDVGCASEGNVTSGLPSYDDLANVAEKHDYRVSLENTGNYYTIPSTLERELKEGPQDVRDYFESVNTSPSRRPPSIRLSADVERPIWNGFGGGEQTSPSRVSSRRWSTNLEESGNEASVSETPSPAFTPSDESTANRLSRAAARLTNRNKSRPQSQTGEARTSMSRARLGGLMRASRDPLPEPNGLNITDGAREPNEVAVDGGEAANGGTSKGHKNGKSKEKHRSKTSPPERECTVM